MMIWESALIALAQLWAHKLRSLLALLGILIGVAAVVSIVSMSEGLRRMVLGEFGKVGGANFLFVQSRQYVERDGRWVPVPGYVPMTMEDVDRITACSDRLSTVLPMVGSGAQVRYAKATYDGEVQGATPELARAYEWDVDHGRFLLDRDLTGLRRVCVLGRTVAEEVFGDVDPVGQEVKIGGQRFAVVGVMSERAIFGQDWGNQVLVPVTTVQRRLLGTDEIAGVLAHTRAPEDGPVVIPKILAALRRAHGRGPEYRVESGQGILEQIESTILIMKLVSGGIAGISLLVGGIGVMNIMLVSVAERTREIGIRKALGAKPGALLVQFVVEAIVLSLCGGLVGIGAGVGLGFGISQVIAHYADQPFPSVVSMGSAFLALGLSSAVGLFFGIYPAARAARLDPVEALGRE
jgi:putative ABC transport system permease protein